MTAETTSAMSSVASFRIRIAAACMAGATIALALPQPAAAREALKNFVMHEAPQAVPAIDFADEKGQAHSLAEFKGKVVVLNIWATWCVPCRKEMPALDRLQAALGGPEFVVVPISIDRSIETAAKFYQDIGIGHLPIYVDVSGKAVRELHAVGLPTTLILDRAGREIGRVVGPAEWDSPEVADLLKPIIANEGEPIRRADRRQPARSDAAGPFARGFQWMKALLSN